MDFLNSIDLQATTGLKSDLFVLGLALIVVVLIIIMIINGIRVNKLKKSYKAFMAGKNGRSLENVLLERLTQVENVIASDAENKKNIQDVLNHLDHTYQKIGLVKYNAFHEMGGKLSFSLALLNRKNDGFILTAMHSREGCFTYIKEVIDGNSIIMLAEEEKEALEMAIKNN